MEFAFCEIFFALGQKCRGRMPACGQEYAQTDNQGQGKETGKKPLALSVLHNSRNVFRNVQALSASVVGQLTPAASLKPAFPANLPAGNTYLKTAMPILRLVRNRCNRELFSEKSGEDKPRITRLKRIKERAKTIVLHPFLFGSGLIRVIRGQIPTVCKPSALPCRSGPRTGIPCSQATI